MAAPGMPALLQEFSTAAANLFTRQQELRPEVFKNHALGRYFHDDGTRGESGLFLVLAHVDEDKTIVSFATVNMNIEV